MSQNRGPSSASAPMRLLASLLFALLLVCSSFARANAIAEALREGGVALLIRHASAPGNFDPKGFRLDDCSTQRNLSASGRDESRRLGAYLKGLGLVPGDVLTSQWCRCRETANLAFGTSRDWRALNSFISVKDKASRQVSEVLARIAQIKPGDKPLVLVTHQVMVTAITGVYPESGEVVVVAPVNNDAQRGVKVIGTLKPNAMK